MTVTFNTRTIVQISVLFLGMVMTLMGLGSVFTRHPYPEFATAGMGAILTSGLVGTIGKDKKSE